MGRILEFLWVWQRIPKFWHVAAWKQRQINSLAPTVTRDFALLV